MTATILNITPFKKILPTLSLLHKDVRLVVENGALRVTAMETANVVLTKYALHNVTVETPFEAIVTTAHLYDAVKKAKDGTSVTIAHEGGRLVVRYDSPRATQYDIPLLEEESMRVPKEPELSRFGAVATINPADLAEAVDDASKLYESALLRVKDGVFTLSTKSDTRGFSTTITMGAFTEHAIATGKDKDGQPVFDPDPARTRYSTEYLAALLSGPAKVYDTVQVSLGRDYPLVLLYQNADSTLRFMAAPRVEND
jgi:hypothetical protein